jgi:hypothetical protein
VVVLAALEPLQGRLHLLDRAHAVVRRRRAPGATGGGRGDGEQVQVHRGRRARVLRQGQLPGLHGGRHRISRTFCFVSFEAADNFKSKKKTSEKS